MPERDSWAVQAAGPTGLLDVVEARVAVGALWTPGASAVVAKSGLRPGPGTSPGLVTASGTPDAFVHVAPFQLAMQTTRAAVGGPYVATLDAVKDINILSTPADPTNPRDDLIVAQQSDTFYGDGTSPFLVRHVVGTPAASPSDPAVSGSGDFVRLARVRVAAGATTITGANITDLRATTGFGTGINLVGGMFTAALGGLLPVASETQRNALVGVYNGFPIWRTDREWVEVHDGTAWRVQGVAVVSSAADLAAVTHPYAGLRAERNDANAAWVYTGTAWRYVFYRDQQTLGATTGSVTFSNIPTALRTLHLRVTARGDAAQALADLRIRVGGDTGNNYRWSSLFTQNGNAPGQANGTANSSALAGYLPCATSASGVFGQTTVEITGWDEPHTDHLTGRGNSGYMDAAANSITAQAVWAYTGTNAYTSLTIFPLTGSFITGSQFHLLGWE